MDRRMMLGALGAAGVVFGLAATPTAQAATPADGPVPVETAAVDSGQIHFAVAVPAGCRRDEGPGTIDAVCAADFNPETSAKASNATALVLGAAAEPQAADADSSIAGLQERYGEAAFKAELPEAVCGESDKARVRIENLSEAIDGPRLVYTANVVCAPVKFLQIGERRAAVRYVIAPEARYRLVGRASADDFEKQRGTIDAFFASFRVLPADRPEK